MIKLKIDTETYSELDITKVGGFKYIAHRSTRPLCLSYKIDDEPTQLWDIRAGEKVPTDLYNAARACIAGLGVAYAFNATFDLTVWNTKLTKYRCPEIPLARWRDAQALCARYKLPQNLRQAALTLKCDVQKMAIGKVLIKKCCTPEGKPTEKDFIDLGVYCKVDTDVLDEILKKLPADYLTDQEQKLWELTYKMNATGVPVDIQEVDTIIRYLKIYMDGRAARLPEITNGFINTPGQVQKIKKFCKDNGFEIPSLSAEAVTTALTQELPEKVREVLELRQELGLSSVSKFLTMHDMYNEGYVQGSLNHYGAGTGRWAGRGVQLHNLPRAKVDNAEEIISAFMNKEIVDDPVNTAKALIRPMIKAPVGRKLIVSDYSSIENRVLAWLAGDENTLQGFRDNFDQYKDMASHLYHVAVEEVTKDQRQFGKAIVLGCGYQMGVIRFQGAAKAYGLDLSTNEATAAVNAYREKYPLIVKMWRMYSQMVKLAVQFPGKTYSTNRCSTKVLNDHNGTKWLSIKLPSGRTLMYMNPRLYDGKYGPVVIYDSVDNTTFQWGKKELTPGLITENITQAAARDILCEGMLEVQKRMPEVDQILCVHDELVGMIDEDKIDASTMDKFNSYLCVDKEYRSDLPLKAEGYIAVRYRKG